MAAVTSVSSNLTNILATSVKDSKKVLIVSACVQSCFATLVQCLSASFSLYGFAIVVIEGVIFALALNTLINVTNNIFAAVLKLSYRLVSNDEKLKNIWDRHIENHYNISSNRDYYIGKLILSIFNGLINSSSAKNLVVEARVPFKLENICLIFSIFLSVITAYDALRFSPSNERTRLNTPQRPPQLNFQELKEKREHFLSTLISKYPQKLHVVQSLLDNEKELWIEVEAAANSNNEASANNIEEPYLNRWGCLQERIYASLSYRDFMEITSNLAANAQLTPSLKKIVQSVEEAWKKLDQELSINKFVPFSIQNYNDEIQNFNSAVSKL